MGGAGCVDGKLATTLYAAPVPLIGLYIAVATLKIIDNPSMDDETRWTSVKFLWAQCNNWFRSKFLSPKFKGCSSLKNFEESDLEQQNACWVLLRDALNAIGEKYRRDGWRYVVDIEDGGSLAKMHKVLIVTEFLIICKFIREQEQEYKSDKDLFDSLEKCLIKMLCVILSYLPMAILKEIKGDYPSEIGEERVRKALKFLCKLELLGETKIEWTWPAEFDPKSDTSLAARSTGTVVAPSCGSEIVATMVAPDFHASVVAADAAARAEKLDLMRLFE